MGLDTRSAIPHPRRSQIAPKESRTANYRIQSTPFAATAKARRRGSSAWRIHIKRIILHIAMRTNIDIDDELMSQAMRASEATTKRAVVEEALRLLIQTRSQAGVRRLRGKVTWEGDLAASRMERTAK